MELVNLIPYDLLSDFLVPGCYHADMRCDGDILREYVETHSEAAFAELVRRHVNLVYSAALRQMNGDAHLAQDVAQNVFNDLARKAASLSGRRDLAGWLYTSAHFAAAKVVRAEQRRRAREQKAHAMQQMLNAPTTEMEWERLQPALDEVMHQLKETDREAILLRYFENRPLSDVGNRLGVGEDAARKRVDRALEKLRTFLLKRGVSTTAGVAAILSANAVQIAPTGLAATLSTAAVASAAAGSGGALVILELITMTKLKAGLISAVAVAGIATTLVVQQHEKARLRTENAALQQQAAQLDELRTENARLSNMVSRAPTAGSLPDEQFSELLKLRGEVGSLRRRTNELRELQAENQRLRSSSRPAASASTADLNSVPRDSWAFVGYADPESAFQSAIWALSRGDVQNAIASLAPSEDAERLKAKIGEDLARAAAGGKSDFDGVTGFKILEKNMVSDGEAILTVFAEGIRDMTTFRMLRVGNEWKFGGPIKGAPTADRGVESKSNLVKKAPPTP